MVRTTFSLPSLSAMLSILALFVSLLPTSGSVYAHGYLEKSRGFLCKETKNQGCGSIIYEPQSLEGNEGFPAGGPPDGTIAGANLTQFSNLNQQTANRWYKNNIAPGNNTFTWHFTANHVTRNWNYYITKPGWNPNDLLDRGDFDLVPFCRYDGNLQRPPLTLRHTCDVPADRTGYHIILAVWDVGDTDKSFYNVVDVMIQNDITPPPWQAIGTISPTRDLSVGDSVRLRLFTAQGERPELETVLTIATAADGASNNWSLLLAQQLNAANFGVQAGELSNGVITPVNGNNTVYAETGSDIVRAEVNFDILPPPTPLLTVTGILSEYPLADDTRIAFTLSSEDATDVSMQLYNSSNAEVASYNTVVDGVSNGELDISRLSAGTYSLVVIAQRGGQSSQQTFAMRLTRPIIGGDISYPDNLGSYQQGTVVIGQAGGTFACQIPGWCNGSSTHYAPGTGLAWQQAWQQTSDQPASPPVEAPSYNYPESRGNYLNGTLVQGTDGQTYRCNIAPWCNSSSDFHYAPGTGIAWDQAWTQVK